MISGNLAQEIANALGVDWQVSDDQPGYGIRIDGPADLGLYLQTAHEPEGRIRINAKWPDSCDANGQLKSFTPYFFSYGPNPIKSPAITCAMSRGATAIAKDIECRFLPKYLPLYEKQAEIKAKTLESAAYKQEILDRLNATALLQGHICLTVSPPELTLGGYLNKGPTATFGVDTYQGLKVNARIHNLTLEQTEEIIRLLVRE